MILITGTLAMHSILKGGCGGLALLPLGLKAGLWHCSGGTATGTTTRVAYKYMVLVL